MTLPLCRLADECLRNIFEGPHTRTSTSFGDGESYSFYSTAETDYLVVNNDQRATLVPCLVIRWVWDTSRMNSSQETRFFQ